MPRGGENNTKYWLLTIWPPSDWNGETERFFECVALGEHVQCIRWQLERGGNTNREHIQAVIQWKRQEGKRACLTRLGIPNDAFHAEAIRYGWERCRDYAAKRETRVGDTAYEWGVWTNPTVGADGAPVPRAREDIKFAGEFIRRGGGLAELAELRPDIVIKFHKGLETTARLLREGTRGRRRVCARRTYILCGPTRTGKTSGVYAHYGDPDVFSPPVRQGTTTWFDGLEGQKVVVFDEFTDDIPFQAMKRFIDPWHDEVAPIKGAHARLSADTVFIISNKEPWLWWKPMEFNVNNFPELASRVTAWVWFGPADPPQQGGVGGMQIPWIRQAAFDWGVGCTTPCNHKMF